MRKLQRNCKDKVERKQNMVKATTMEQFGDKTGYVYHIFFLKYVRLLTTSTQSFYGICFSGYNDY